MTRVADFILDLLLALLIYAMLDLQRAPLWACTGLAAIAFLQLRGGSWA